MTPIQTIRLLLILGFIWLQPIYLLAQDETVVIPEESLASARIPIVIELKESGYVTVVIEDSKGNRVCNLLSNTRLGAGKTTLYWNGYGLPVKVAHKTPEILYTRVSPGDYTVRGMIHQGIKLKYEMSVYTAGKPAWPTADGSGEWLGDHGPPADVCYLPETMGISLLQGSDGMLIKGTGAEAGHNFAFTDLKGRKLYGARGYASRGIQVARDVGPKPDKTYVAYFANPETLNGLTRELEDVEIVGYSRTPRHSRTMGSVNRCGLAVYNGIAVLADGMEGVLRVIDVANKSKLGTIPVAGVRDVVFDTRGDLYVLSAKSLKRCRLDAQRVQLTHSSEVIASGLQDAQQMTLHNGRILVTDWKTSHQVKIFSDTGKPIKSIGTPGGLKLGTYDPTRFNRPYGLAVDSDNVLWVCEFGFAPKRVSRWTLDGKLLTSLLGPTKYGGGGSIDPKDKSRFYYAGGAQTGLEFKLDWEKGTSELKDIYYKGPVYKEKYVPGSTWKDLKALKYDGYDRSFCDYDMFLAYPPQRSIHHQGHQYLVRDFNSKHKSNECADIFLMQKDGTVRPVAAFLSGFHFDKFRTWDTPLLHVKEADAIYAHVLKLAGIKDSPDKKLPYKKMQLLGQHFFIWSDLNFDGRVQANELQIGRVPNGRDMGRAKYFVHNNLDLTTSLAGYLKLQRITSEGVPVYDANTIEWLLDFDADPLPDGVTYVSPMNDSILHAKDDWIMIKTGGFGTPGLGLTGHKGTRKWTYRTDPKHIVPQKGGTIACPLELVGPVMYPTSGQAKSFFGINGDKGEISILTMDGLFIDTLGADQRVHPVINGKNIKRGDLLENVSFQGEHYHPTLNQTSDGKIYLVAGKTHASIFELAGLDTIRRLGFGTVSVGEKVLATVPERQLVLPLQKGEGYTGGLTSFKTMYAGFDASKGMTVDGNLEDWNRVPARNWTKIDSKASGALFFDKVNMYVAYKLGDPNTIKNSGKNFRYYFKTGGGLDIMLGSFEKSLYAKRTAANPNLKMMAPGTDDLRIFITRLGDTFKTVIYRQKFDKKLNNHTYESPLGSVSFDYIVDISDSVKVTQQGNAIEASIPLSIIGLEINNFRTIMGDVGLVRGNGFMNTQRLYWHNKDTVNVNDDPSEARLVPKRWGKIIIKRLSATSNTQVVHKETPRRKNVRVNKRENSYPLWQYTEMRCDWTDKPWEFADAAELQIRVHFKTKEGQEPLDIFIDNLRVSGFTKEGKEIDLLNFDFESPDTSLPDKIKGRGGADYQTVATSKAPKPESPSFDLGKSVYHCRTTLAREEQRKLTRFQFGEGIPITLPEDLDRTRPLYVSLESAVDKYRPGVRGDLSLKLVFEEKGEVVGKPGTRVSGW